MKNDALNTVTENRDFPPIQPEQIPEVSRMTQRVIRTYDTYSQSLLDKYAVEQISKDIARKQDTYVCIKDNQVIATVSQVRKKVPKLSNTFEEKDMRNILLALFVDPNQQAGAGTERKGYGTRLVQFIESKAKAAGHKYFLVPARPEAIGFYLKLGYSLKQPPEEMTRSEIARFDALEKQLAEESGETIQTQEERKKRQQEMTEYLVLRAKKEPITEKEVHEYEMAEDMELFQFEKNIIRMWKKLD